MGFFFRFCGLLTLGCWSDTLLLMQLALATPTLASWLAACPDSGALEVMLREFHDRVQHQTYQLTPQKCYECGGDYLVGQLRADYYSPYGTGELVCRECYELFDQGTVAHPEHRAPPWIAQPEATFPGADVALEAVPHVREIWVQNRRVGTVTSYNPVHHTGFVCYDAFPDSGEWGSLDSDHVVQP